MGDIKGFLKVKRQIAEYRPVCERVEDYREVNILPKEESSRDQGSRCMDCGVPFCHWGCPLANYIPEWNDAIFRGNWEKAIGMLCATNSFPEFTGRLCPAPCEFACVLGINDEPVTIKENELAIIEYAFEEGLIKPLVPKNRSRKKIAIVGSGPAGLSCADRLNKAGHSVTVFERDDKIGGILRYGIPDFKLEKWIIDRRIKILKKEGINFITGVNVGVDLAVSRLKKEFNVVCLTGGSSVPRDLDIEGRDLSGIYFAMDYLVQANRRVSGSRPECSSTSRTTSGSRRVASKNNIIRERTTQEVTTFGIDAKDKRVVVIGGGDTGADCVGTAHRQKASCVVQIEIIPQPAGCRTEDYPWPHFPLILKTSTSHEEGGERHWSILTKKFIGENGNIRKISCVKTEYQEVDNKRCPVIKEIKGSEFDIEADLVILAMGFVHPRHDSLLKDLGVKLDLKGNVETDRNYMTSIKGIFSAGDMRSGQSLIVKALSDGRMAAYHIDKYLIQKG
jgi:glutamate synthase (NADPH/NADH) small chain